MNNWRLVLIGLLCTLHLTAYAAPRRGDKSEEPRRVYMFGVAVNFNDSTMYMTDVQSLDSIVINTDGSLRNYAAYSQQLEFYIEGVLREADQTCAVIYSDKKKKLEKRFVKLQRELSAKRSEKLRRIGTDEFAFKRR